MAQETGKNLPSSPKALRKETVAAHQTAESPWATVSIRACCRVIKENWKAHVQFLAVDPKTYGLNAQPKIDKTETMPDRSNVDVVAIFQKAYRSAASSPSSFRQGNSKLKRGLSGTVDGFKVSALADTGAAQNVVSSNFARVQRLHIASSPSSALSGTIDGLEVSALADTGADQNFVSSNFARARKLDVALSPSSFRLADSTLVHSPGTSKYQFDTLTK